MIYFWDDIWKSAIKSLYLLWNSVLLESIIKFRHMQKYFSLVIWWPNLVFNPSISCPTITFMNTIFQINRKLMNFNDLFSIVLWFPQYFWQVIFLNKTLYATFNKYLSNDFWKIRIIRDSFYLNLVWFNNRAVVNIPWWIKYHFFTILWI